MKNDPLVVVFHELKETVAAAACLVGEDTWLHALDHVADTVPGFKQLMDRMSVSGESIVMTADEIKSYIAGSTALLSFCVAAYISQKGETKH